MKTETVFSAAHQLFDFEPAQVRCPYPTFHALRDTAPVAWFPEIDSFVVTDYELIVEVLRQPETFSNRSATGRATDREIMRLVGELVVEDPEVLAITEHMAASDAGPVLLQADPPGHGRQRALVNRAFTPASIRRIEPDIELLANRLIDSFAYRGRVELLAEFAVPLPMTVIASALGVSLDRMDDFIRWSKISVSAIGKRTFEKADVADVLRARAELADYLLSVVDERFQEPKDDLISQLVQARIEGERLSRHEVVSMSVQFLLAGNDTTAKLIATAMLGLASEPDRADRLRSRPDLVGPFIEETLRMEPPINGTYRIANVDYELGGVKIPADSSLWLVYAAGNRDPSQFPTPDEFQSPQPSKTPHLAFGFGAHFCLGATLARAESQIAIRALLARCVDIELDVEPEAVVYEPSFMLHGLHELPLAFRPSRPPVR